MSLKHKILEKVTKTKEFFDNVKKNEVPELKKSLHDLKKKLKDFDPLGLILTGLNNIDLYEWSQNLLKKDPSQKVSGVNKDIIRKKMEDVTPPNMDKSEDLFESWKNLREDRDIDAFSEEVSRFLQSLLEDISTNKGLPFDAKSFDIWAEILANKVPGMQKEDIQELFYIDGIELLSTSMGMVSALFALNREDEEKLAEILATLGITSLMSVNPPLALTVVFISGYAFFYKKLTFDKKAFAKSSVLTFSNFSSFALMSALGISFTSRLLLVGLISQTLKKEVLENDDFLESLRKQIDDQKETIRDVLEHNPQVLELIHEIKERSLNIKNFLKTK